MLTGWVTGPLWISRGRWNGSPHSHTVMQEKPELQHRNILLDGTAGCSTCIGEKVLVMEREGLVCSIPQTAHQIILTVSLSCNAAETAIFHPKSQKRLISFTSHSLKGNIMGKWQHTRHIKRSQSVWAGLLCLANLQRSSWILIATSCSISQLGGSCCWKTSFHI